MSLGVHCMSGLLSVVGVPYISGLLSVVYTTMVKNVYLAM